MKNDVDTDSNQQRVRPSWTEYFKTIVDVTATRSPCKRLQVGCLLVKDNRIVSQGYNGFLPGCSHESAEDGHEQATAQPNKMPLQIVRNVELVVTARTHTLHIILV